MSILLKKSEEDILLPLKGTNGGASAGDDDGQFPSRFHSIHFFPHETTLVKVKKKKEAQFRSYFTTDDDALKTA